MFGAILGAIPGIIGAIMQGSALSQQQNMEWQNLQFQKRNAADQMDLATATRVDPYGNREEYDPLTHTWKNVETPQTRAILDAMQKEQQAGLEEQGLQREDRARQRARSKEAGQEYETLLSQYKNNPPKSEGGYADEFTKDALYAMQDRTRKAGGDLARLAVRSGHDPKALGGIIDAVANQEAAGMGDAVIAGKQAGRQAHGAAEQMYQSKLGPLKFFAGLQDDIGGFTPERSTAGGDITSMQRDMETAISQALANQSNEVGGAYRGLASSLGQSPSLEGIANALANFKLDGGSSFSAPITGGGAGGVGSGSTGLGINGGFPISDPYGSGYSVNSRTGSGNDIYQNPFDVTSQNPMMSFTWP